MNTVIGTAAALKGSAQPARVALFLLVVLSMLAALAGVSSKSAGAASTNTVLILGSTVVFGVDSREAQAVTAAGFTPGHRRQYLVSDDNGPVRYVPGDRAW
jgi:hypothetical protein